MDQKLGAFKGSVSNAEDIKGIIGDLKSSLAKQNDELWSKMKQNEDAQRVLQEEVENIIAIKVSNAARNTQKVVNEQMRELNETLLGQIKSIGDENRQRMQ